MPYDPLEIRIALTKKEFMKGAIRDYKQSGFT